MLQSGANMDTISWHTSFTFTINHCKDLDDLKGFRIMAYIACCNKRYSVSHRIKMACLIHMIEQEYKWS